MNKQQEKRDYIRLKYTNLANKILALIETDEKIDMEINHKLFGLWEISHFLDCSIIYWEEYIKHINNK